MTEFSLWTRVGATLLLVALSLAAWMWLQASSPSSSGGSASSSSSLSTGGNRASATTKTKKKTKKRAKKAATAGGAGSQDNASAAVAVDPTTSDHAAANEVAASESEDESDEDEGLSAVQILARRKFKTKAIGGKAATAAALAMQQQAKLLKYEAGQQVLARFQSGEEWFPATIAEVRRGNEYNLKYDDGEVEYRVSYKLIKVRPSLAAPAASATSPSAAIEASLTASNSHQEDNTSTPVTAAAGAVSEPSSDEEEVSDEDDGWAIVGAAGNKSRARKSGGGAYGGANAVDSPRTGGDGLTKRQRESRRKKERQKEIKELARAQAQGENGLHAKWGGTYSKMKYVPPPTQG